MQLPSSKYFKFGEPSSYDGLSLDIARESVEDCQQVYPTIVSKQLISCPDGCYGLHAMPPKLFSPPGDTINSSSIPCVIHPRLPATPWSTEPSPPPRETVGVGKVISVRPGLVHIYLFSFVGRYRDCISRAGILYVRINIQSFSCKFAHSRLFYVQVLFVSPLRPSRKRLETSGSVCTNSYPVPYTWLCLRVVTARPVCSIRLEDFFGIGPLFGRPSALAIDWARR